MAPQGRSPGRQAGGGVERLTLNPPAGSLSCMIANRGAGPLLGDDRPPSHSAPQLCWGGVPSPGEKLAQASQRRGTPAVLGRGRLKDLTGGLGIPADAGRPPGWCTVRDLVRRVLRGAKGGPSGRTRAQSVRTAWSERG